MGWSVLLTVAWLAGFAAATSQYIMETFTDINNSGNFTHLVVHNTTGKIYVGAVNRLYALSDSLNAEKVITTGPKDDNPNCPPLPLECTCTTKVCDDFVRRPSNSINKALVIDEINQRLIACFNIFQGRCEKRHLDDISQHDPVLRASLVPNDDLSPVTMFIAPGPGSQEHNEVLYIGATRSTTGLTAYNDLVPSISSRNLSNFEIAYTDVSSATKKELEYQQRDLFTVNYIYGFSSGGFSYFLTVQRHSLEVSTSVSWVTRIVRICQKDKMYYSYAEVPLQCTYEGQSFNVIRAAYVTHAGAILARSLGLSDQPPITDNDHVLFALFSKSHYQSMTPTNDSVLCIYPLKNVRRVFTEVIQDCFSGIGNTGPPHIVPTKVCVRTTFNIGDDYCGQHDFNNPVAGSKPVTANAIIRWEETYVTSISVMATHEYTIAMVGTSDGHVKKVVIESGTEAKEYESIPIDEGSPVNSNMAFDGNKEHVYVMTAKKVSKVKVQNCSQYVTCAECLGARDPFCGWCVLEKKCGKQTECENFDKGRRWLPYSGTECTRITEVVPRQVQTKKSGVSRLVLSIQNLPTLTEGSYQCAFGHPNVGAPDLLRLTSATIGLQKNDTTRLSCETPFPNLLPPIPTGKDHIVMALSVRTNGKDFVSRDFTFFDCGLHSACTSCTKSKFPCTWCVQHHKCTNNKETCLGDILITGQAVEGVSDRPGPGNCPKFESSYTEILVPSGKDEEVQVKALNLQDFQQDFKCSFNIEGQTQEVSAVKLPNDNNIPFIRCHKVNFLYQAQTAHLNVPFQIFWGDRKPLDNPDRIQVEVYKCEKMADNCGGCLTSSQKYQCGWCDVGCTIQEQCETNNWRNSSMDCPNPRITSFSPISGPLKGGTRVTIHGENLGKNFDDIRSGVLVAGETCTPEADSYVPAMRIVCITGNGGSVKSGHIQITIGKKYSDETAAKFSYVEPTITDFHPTQGPQSGGTQITILGSFMDTGTNRTATVAGLPCPILENSVTAASVVCITSQNSLMDVATGKVTVKFDEDSVTFPDKDFLYVRDPNITSVSPHRTILSGGINVTVTGSNLDAVQYPKMYIKKGNREFTGPCTGLNSTWMVCRTPSLQAAVDVAPTHENPLHFPFGFHMDSVKDLLNYSLSHQGQMLEVHPDPLANQFNEGVKRVTPKEDDHLTISGEFTGLTLMDVMVKVGSSDCEVTSISKSYIICTMSSPDMDDGGPNPKVMVIVGNYNKTVGKLKYENTDILSLPTIIGIGVGGGFLIIIIIIVCIAYRQKSRERDRVMKRMQNQMDVLEARVAKECKEAFAELQTDMSELTSDLSGPVGIPFRDYRNFCMHVLFPQTGEGDHPVIRPLEVDLARRDGIERGLRLFNTLVLNKTFLLLFIRTLEYHKDFSMRERVNVASLISVALQGRMEHHTDILKTLLADLIERSMEGRSHPKLLLRRTESVAEKMLTNWFTFLLYKFLKECAGEPLFMLYRAIKQQVDKGPVDIFTGEAKYSLSEDKLIRQQIDYRTLMLHVIDPDQYGGQEHVVKVLDCDTITQVKEKILDAIYKNAPHSNRPDKDDLDLEWRTGVKGRVILQDEDMTSKSDGGEFKRINTLSHYQVSDMALMALIPKQSSMYNLSFGSDRSGSNHRFDTYMSGSPSLTRPLAPHTIHLDMENGTKYYHLVKQHDTEMQKEGDRGSKMVSEIYLTRLLATKGTLQQFVDDLFETIFSTANRGSALPLAIKYMFDFLDDQALYHGINDPEVVHTWKSNSLPLRFWVNVVKNPDFVFDIHKSNIVDSCLSVVAQTFMDSCSMSEHRLGKDSPSSKLLYAKDIPKYKRWVERYYQDIKLMPAISEQDMNAMLAEESRLHMNEFNINAALYELYQYVARYNDELMETLAEDEFARNYRLPQKLEQVHNCMDSYA